MTSPGISPLLLKNAQSEILIATDDDAVAHKLQTLFRAAGLNSVCTRSVAAASYAAKSGQYPVIFTTPSLADGSWRHLLDASIHGRTAPAVVVVAHSFDINEWAETLRYGAFDVLDSILEMARAPEVASRAFSAASGTTPACGSGEPPVQN